MPTRRVELPLPACKADTVVLRWTENYLLQAAADLFGAAKVEFSRKYSVTIQDSWGSTEYHSIEDVDLPLDPGVQRIRFALTGYDGGDEYFSINVTFASNPSLATFQMRLTGDTAETVVNGRWADITKKLASYSVDGFVRRFGDGWLLGLLVGGVLLGAGGAALLAFQEFTWGVSLLVACLLVSLYTYCSWMLPHCIFETARNERLLDWNKWIWRTVFTSVGVGAALRVVLRFAYGL